MAAARDSRFAPREGGGNLLAAVPTVPTTDHSDPVSQTKDTCNWLSPSGMTFPIYMENKHVPNHQPVQISFLKNIDDFALNDTHTNHLNNVIVCDYTNAPCK